MTERKLVRLKINGVPQEVYVKPNWTLYHLLKKELGLTGVKAGCDEIGECGYCTVLMDGKAAPSCLVLAIECEGKNIITVEGLAPAGELDPVQEAFIKYGAFQCGYCTPGMILTVKALLDRNQNPTEEEVKEALGGVICRCGGYYKAIEGVMSLRKGG